MDFTYITDGLFTTIMPETPQAIALWNEHFADRRGVFMFSEWPGVMLQLKQAGYSVRKSPTIKQSDDELLAELS